MHIVDSRPPKDPRGFRWYAKSFKGKQSRKREPARFDMDFWRRQAAFALEDGELLSDLSQGIAAQVLDVQEIVLALPQEIAYRPDPGVR